MEKAQSSPEISLGEFVKRLAALLQEKSVEMPFKDEESWHVLFYELAKQEWPGKPGFF